MRTKEEIEEIAQSAKTTPEIVEAVLSAYYKDLGKWKVTLGTQPGIVKASRAQPKTVIVEARNVNISDGCLLFHSWSPVNPTSLIITRAFAPGWKEVKMLKENYGKIL